MREDFLHYIWKFTKFDFLHAQTAEEEPIEIFEAGRHNQSRSGPDFFNAKLKIGGQLWAGNVEVHLKSSDWYAHHHEKDAAYDNVVLHVVWQHDVNVYRQDNSPIPTLVLKRFIHRSTFNNYQNLLGINTNWINCEKDFSGFSDFEVQNWLERLYIERLEEKSKTIKKILHQTTNNWEATLFKLLAKNFGLNKNGKSFLSLANSFPFKILTKIKTETGLEALFFGQLGLLQQHVDNAYFNQLQSEYRFLIHKFNLSGKGVFPVDFFRLRPPNFPTIRLSQLAVLLNSEQNLFSKLINSSDLEEICRVFKIEASPFWDTHYTFAKESKPRSKRLTKRFVDLLIINTVIPMKFCYARHKGSGGTDHLIGMLRDLPKENNRIVDGFNRLRPKTADDALSSQALIHLKKEYCDKNRCLHCNLGQKLLQKP